MNNYKVISRKNVLVNAYAVMFFINKPPALNDKKIIRQDSYFKKQTVLFFIFTVILSFKKMKKLLRHGIDIGLSNTKISLALAAASYLDG